MHRFAVQQTANKSSSSSVRTVCNALAIRSRKVQDGCPCSLKCCSTARHSAPCYLRRTTSHVVRRLYGSMPDVGSSRNTTAGWPRNAMATDSLRR
jgi:hypothetical protein